MKRRRKLAAEIALLVASVCTAAVSAAGAIGHPARLVDVVTLFAAGVGTGAGIALTVTRWRARQRGEHTRS
jgi:hypothetical protein